MEESIMIASYLQNEWSVQLNDNPSIEEINKRLSAHIKYLINNDFDQLLRLLYKVDVSESRLKFLLKEKAGEDAGQIIASMVIERQFQKIHSRRHFKPGNRQSDEEKL